MCYRHFLLFFNLFKRILDINSEVVTVLYENLMEDVKLLCEYHLDELSDVINNFKFKILMIIN